MSDIDAYIHVRKPLSLCVGGIVLEEADFDNRHRHVCMYGIGNAMCFASLMGDNAKLIQLLETSGVSLPRLRELNTRPLFCGASANPNTRGDFEFHDGEFLHVLGRHPTPLLSSCCMGNKQCVKVLLDARGILHSGVIANVRVMISNTAYCEAWRADVRECIRMVVASMWRRVGRNATCVGKISLYMRRVFEEVYYRPGGRGAMLAKEDFEVTASQEACMHAPRAQNQFLDGGSVHATCT